MVESNFIFYFLNKMLNENEGIMLNLIVSFWRSQMLVKMPFVYLFKTFTKEMILTRISRVNV